MEAAAAVLEGADPPGAGASRVEADAASDGDDVEVVGERSREERDAAGREQAVSLQSEDDEEWEADEVGVAVEAGEVQAAWAGASCVVDLTGSASDDDGGGAMEGHGEGRQMQAGGRMAVEVADAFADQMWECPMCNTVYLASTVRCDDCA